MYIVTITNTRPSSEVQWFYRSSPEAATLWENVINAQAASPGFINLELKTPLDHPTSQVWEVKWDSEAACKEWEKNNQTLLNSIYIARSAYSKDRGTTRTVVRTTV